MATLEELMNTPSKEIKPPEAYPVGTYHCIVDGPPEQGKSSQKQTDFLRFKLKIMSALADVDAQKAAEAQITGKTLQVEYYLTEAALWRFKEFLIDHLGIVEGDKSLKELVAETQGRQLLVKLRHELSQDGKRVFHRVDSTAHV